MPRVTPPTAFEDGLSEKPRIGVGKSKKSQRSRKASVNDRKKTAEEGFGEAGEVGDTM